MLFGLTILSVTAAAGLIAGGGAVTFLAAALAAVSATWLRRIRAAFATTLYANLDPRTPDGSILLDAFREALDRVRRTRSPVRLRLTSSAVPSCPVFSLELNREGDMDLIRSPRRVSLKRPGVWLPDHPLPLVLPRKGSLTLLFEPDGQTRIRVSQARASHCRSGHWLLLSLLASAACALDLGWLLAAVLGFAFQLYLLEQQTDRAPYDARVKRG